MTVSALTAAMAEDVLRRTVRMCVALEGVVWTTTAVQDAARAPVLAAGFGVAVDRGHVPLEEAAAMTGLAVDAMIWQLRACGIEPSGIETMPAPPEDSPRAASWPGGLRLRGNDSADGAEPEYSPRGRRDASAASSRSRSND